jgi:cyclase
MRQAINRASYIFSVLPAAIAFSAVAFGQGQDFSKVEIKTNKITSNFYTLDGQGGTIGVLAGPDGVLMVDSQFAPLSEKIAAAIKQISPSPIRFLVNTHVHGDHTGGDENFGKMGVTIFAREELRERLAHPAPLPNGNPAPAMPAVGLPVVTYDGPVKIHMNGEVVDLIPVRTAHTDGDTMVRFENANVVMTGDFYRSTGYPFFDHANGGTLTGLIEGLDQTIKLCGPETKVIPGHGAIVDRAAVTAHRDMIIAVRDQVAKLISQGKSQQEVLAAKLTAPYDARVPGGNAQAGGQTSADRFVTILYTELKGAK